MKKTNTLYWTFTGIFGAFMMLSAIPDILLSPDVIKFMKDLLGYPNYFTLFIGVAKALGVIAILIPGFPRIKEWAYAGLMFDLIGAVYSLISIGSTVPEWIFLLLPITLGVLSYIYYHKRLKGFN